MKNYLLILVLILPGMAVFAQECDTSRPATTPDRIFIMNEDGTVKHRNTGLVWMRCALGQQWQDGHCAYTHLSYSFTGAVGAVYELNTQGGFAGHQDWRLPSLQELTALVEQRCEAPAINIVAFPDAPVTGYWSSTKDPDYSSGAMLIHLVNGHSYMGNVDGTWALRLVRND